MIRNTLLKILLGVVLVIVALGLLRFKPWQRSESQQAGDHDNGAS